MLYFVRNHLDSSKMHGKAMCGKAYDGASNMSRKTKRVGARISSQYPLALYTHCTSHCLNLAVVASFEEVSVCNMIGVEKRLSIFFAHPKHQKKLKEAVQNIQPESNMLKLKHFCRIRWLERIDALDCIKKHYSSIFACFENISAESSRM